MRNLAHALRLLWAGILMLVVCLTGCFTPSRMVFGMVAATSPPPPQASMPPPRWLFVARPAMPLTLAARAAAPTPYFPEPLVPMRLRSWVRVQPGDTLWSLAQAYHVSVQQLELWNGLNDDNVLYPGEIIIIDPVFPPPDHPIPRTVASNAVTAAQSRHDQPEYAEAAVIDTTLGGAVARYAMRFIGVPYRWGGTTPAGFDCSGFVQYVFSHFGVELPRTSEEQYGCGTPVSLANLAVGDLVFFDANGPGPTHVGIYLGGGRFIDAGSDGVGIDSLSNTYWQEHYIGARRIVRGS